MVIEGVVAFVFHKYVPPPLAVNVAVLKGVEHNDVGVIVAVGLGKTVTAAIEL